MLLRAPLRNYISLIWPSIAQKHGLVLPSSVSLDSYSKAKKTSTRLELAYVASLTQKEEFLKGALNSFTQLESSQSLSSGDFLVLGILLYSLGDGSFQFKTPEFIQYQLLQILQSNSYSPAELCLVLLIFKRTGIHVDFFGLRQQLYIHLHQLVSKTSAKRGNESVEEFCIVNLAVVLNKHSHLVYQDDPKVIQRILRDAQFNTLPIKASIKVMSLGVYSGIVSREAFSINYKRLEKGEVRHLSLRELLGFLYFCVKTDNSLEKSSLTVNTILDLLRNTSPMSETDVIDRLTLFSYLVQLDIHEDFIYQKLAGVIEELPSDQCLNIDFIFQKAAQVLCPGVSIPKKSSSQKLAHLLLTTIMSYRFHDPALTPSPDVKKLIEISKLIPERPPSKNSIELKVFNALREAYFSKEEVSFCQILAHFPSPSLLFGHVAGNPVPIPSYILEASREVKPAPDVGEWFVVMGVDSSPSKDEDSIRSLDELLSMKERKLKKQLEFLGYKIIVVSSNDLVSHGRRIAEKVLRWSFETK